MVLSNKNLILIMHKITFFFYLVLKFYIKPYEAWKLYVMQKQNMINYVIHKIFHYAINVLTSANQ